MIMDKTLLMPTEKVNEDSLVDFSVVGYSLSLMNEANLEIINAMESIGVITEASGNKRYNFDGILQAIVDAICNVLKYIMGKILAFFVKLGSYGKTFELEIRAFKDRLRSYPGYLRFDNYVNYTYIDDFENYPSSNLVNLLKEDINNYIEKFRKLIEKNNNFSELQFAIGNLKPEIDKDTAVFRYELLGDKDNKYAEGISDETYNLECYKLFRGGKSDAYIDADISSREMGTIYDRYVNATKNQRHIKRENARIQKDIKKAKDSINRTPIDVSKFSDSEQQTILHSYTEVQQTVCELFNRKCKDIVTMYSAKLQAYKDFQIQSRRILTLAMQKLVQRQEVY